MRISKLQLAKSLDHSLLKPEVTDDDVKVGCEIALRHNVSSASVKPCHIELAASMLEGSDVLVGTTVGFPHGCNTTAVKVFEVQDALARGAQEFDLVMNYGFFLSGHFDQVRDDIVAVKSAAGGSMILKVIIEFAQLTEDQIVRACGLVEQAGADFVKSSSGFVPGLTTPDVIRLMRKSVSPQVQVKAAYGVRSYEDVIAMLEAGASRCAVRCTEEVMTTWEALHGSGQ
jgi:deoxyribose-phosphate aldolase